MVKQATKGQKDIYQDNQSTLQFYGLACLFSSLVYGIVTFFIYGGNTTTGWVCFAGTVVIQLVAIFLMKRMAIAHIDSRGHVADAGMDLNDPSAFGEHCKDAIIITVLAQVVGLFTNYAYLSLLYFPGTIGYKIIFSFILPWCTASSEEGSQEMDDKKMKKKERREKFVYRR